MPQNEDGYFWYHSRTDDIIVTSGFKIQSWKVESAIKDHGGVEECVVVHSPEPIGGSVIKAFVVVKEGFKLSTEMETEIKVTSKASWKIINIREKLSLSRVNKHPAHSQIKFKETC